MSRLPTVKLKHKKTGATKKVNRTDYSRDYAKYNDWIVISERDGDATVDEVLYNASQSDIEKQRRRDQVRQKWSGDEQRAYEGRRVTSGGIILP
jgi:hypothetical protein